MSDVERLSRQTVWLTRPKVAHVRNRKQAAAGRVAAIWASRLLSVQESKGKLCEKRTVAVIVLCQDFESV